MEPKTKKGEKQRKEKKPTVHNHQSKTVHPPPPGYVPSVGPSEDIVVRLENLKELLDKKLVTKEEYKKKRSEILSQL
jgi:hypothetical protein